MLWLSGSTLLFRIREVPGTNPGDRLFGLTLLVDFLSPCKQNAGMATYLKLGHDRYIPRPFRFVIHMSFFHSTLYSLGY
jgi:hypothetical protein